ncbi:hypothetical protein LINPERHAP1_LOCUS15182 [Linum perenne]
MTSGHTIPMSETVNCQAIIISRPESDPPHNSAQRSNLLQEHQMIPFNCRQNLGFSFRCQRRMRKLRPITMDSPSTLLQPKFEGFFTQTRSDFVLVADWRGWVEAERMGQQGEAAEKDEKVDVVVERVDGGER